MSPDPATKAERLAAAWTGFVRAADSAQEDYAYITKVARAKCDRTFEAARAEYYRAVREIEGEPDP